MKKTISLMLALASISSMGVSAMAANDTGEPMVIAPAPSVVATAQRQFVVNGKAMQLDSYTTARSWCRSARSPRLLALR